MLILEKYQHFYLFCFMMFRHCYFGPGGGVIKIPVCRHSLLRHLLKHASLLVIRMPNGIRYQKISPVRTQARKVILAGRSSGRASDLVFSYLCALWKTTDLNRAISGAFLPCDAPGADADQCLSTPILTKK